MSVDRTTIQERQKILVVDDSPDVRKFLKSILKAKGYHVSTASSGPLALEAVAAELPDLILLDVRMPDMDGFEVCRRLKADEHSRPIPVLFISAVGDTTQKLEGFEAGGVDYITKPFESGEALARIKNHLRLRHLTDNLEQEVTRRTEDLQNIFNLSLDLVCIADINTATFKRVNPAFQRTLGHSEEELLSRPFLEFVHPDDVSTTAAVIDEQLKQGKHVTQFENRYRCRDGSYRWLNWISYPAPEEGLTYAVARDFTDRKEAEERVRLAAEVSSDLIYEWDITNDTLQWFGDIDNFLGFMPGEFPRTIESWVERIHPDDVARLAEAVERHRTSTEPIRYEYRIKRRDGSWRYWSDHGIPILDELGRPCKWVGACKDITDQKQTEERLARVNECLLNLGSDFSTNVNVLTALCGELLGATCALYNRIESGMLCSLGQWQPPPGYDPADKPDGHICYDLIKDEGRNELMVRNLPETAYAKTDPNVARYGLQTYFGHVVTCGTERVGSLCVVFQADVEASAEDTRFLGIVASALSAEELRLKAEGILAQRERYFRSLLYSMHEDIVVIDRDCVVSDVNSTSLATTGLLREDTVGKKCFDVLHGYSERCEQPEGHCAVQQVFETGESCNCQHAHRRADGAVVYVDILASPLRDNAGRITHVIQAMRDVTEVVLAQDELRASEERFRTLFEIAVDGILLADVETRLLRMPNPRICTLLGYTAEELCALTVDDIHPEEDLPHVRDQFDKLARVEITVAQDIPVKRKNGTVFIADISSSPFELTGRKYLLGMFRDVTERKRAEEARKEHVRFLESLDQINRASHGSDDVEEMLWAAIRAVSSIFDSDRTWLMYPCDPEATSVRVPVEHSRPEFPGAFARDVDIPMSRGADLLCADALASEGPVTCGPGGMHPLQDGIEEQFGVQSQMVMALRPKVGEPWLFGMHQCSHTRIWTEDEQALFKEIAARISDSLSSMLFFRDLQESEKWHRTVVEASKDAMIAIDQDGLITVFNASAEAMFGWARKDVIGRSPDLLMPADQRERHQQYVADFFATGDPHGAIGKTVELLAVQSDGTEFPIALSLSAGGREGQHLVLALVRDISQRKREEERREQLEQQLRQAQKMEAVGQLAGGIAHDFNNLLQAIGGYTELAKEDMPQGHAAREDLEQVQKAARRATALVRQLLAFSRRESLQLAYLDLNNLVGGLMKMIRRLIGEHIDLGFHPGADLQSVYADSGQLEQIVLNLCVNARDAVSTGGKILIETQKVELDSDYCATHPEAQQGAYVVLSVSDTGEGISPEVQDRIFEPFFTTKDVGEGTGLGLATVYAITQRHEGFLTLHSEVGRGATFRVHLPAAEESAEGFDESQEGRVAAQGKGETILLAEDELQVRELAIHFLERAGYKVVGAVNGEEAIDLFRKDMKRFDLALLDVVMPKKNGLDVFDFIRAHRPELPVIFATGYSFNILDSGFLPAEEHILIQKPFIRGDLLATVRRALGKHSEI